MIRKIVAILLVAALPSLPALADPGKGKGNGNSNGKGQSGKSGKPGKSGGSGSGKNGNQGNSGNSGNQGNDHDHDAPRFSSRDRDFWHEYWEDEYQHGNCPPGLAKKHNGCMPPGQAKKRYVIGRPLPPDVVVLPVPVVLLPRLAPIPSGYRYGMIDGDLVKLAIGTMLVVDAIDGLTH